MLRPLAAVFVRPGAQPLGRCADIRSSDGRERVLELLRLFRSRDLPRLDTGILDHFDVLAIGGAKRLDIGANLLRDVVGELRERLGLLCELVRASRGSGERRADRDECRDEASAVLVGEVEVRVGVGARALSGRVVGRGLRQGLLDRRLVGGSRLVVAAATRGDQRESNDEDRLASASRATLTADLRQVLGEESDDPLVAPNAIRQLQHVVPLVLEDEVVDRAPASAKLLDEIA